MGPVLGGVWGPRERGGADDGVVRAMVSEESDDETISLATVWGRALVFYVDEINVLKGPGRGVRAVKLDDYDRVLGFSLSTRARDGLEVQTSRGRTEIVRTTKYRPTRRGGKGREILKRGKLVSCRFDAVEIRLDPAAAEPEDEPRPEPEPPAPPDPLDDAEQTRLEF